MDIKDLRIAIIGLGYVGLPLAIEFSKKFKVIGFDTSDQRINELNNHIDKTGEIESINLREALDSGNLSLSQNPDDLSRSNFYIITVPTPIDDDNLPDLRPLENASSLVGRFLKSNDIVVYESTVFPGATEEVCVPILESQSGLIFNKDFYCGYSPERINPGDKEHTLTNIIKITAGSNKFSSDLIDSVYSSIINAGTHNVSSIKVAEAAKIIENTQRDLNIALINELAIIFNKMDIPTHEVLDAASTKWNFQKFKPGLVGGHCIGVDPYYLTYKSESIGYVPKVILAGRKINDEMSEYVVNRLVTSISQSDIDMESAKLLVLGLAFKANCNDTRNSKAFNLVEKLSAMNFDLTIYDPHVRVSDDFFNQTISQPIIQSEIDFGEYDVILITVLHDEFLDLGLRNPNTKIIFDISGNHPHLTESL